MLHYIVEQSRSCHPDLMLLAVELTAMRLSTAESGIEYSEYRRLSPLSDANEALLVASILQSPRMGHVHWAALAVFAIISETGTVGLSSEDAAATFSRLLEENEAGEKEASTEGESRLAQVADRCVRAFLRAAPRALAADAFVRSASFPLGTRLCSASLASFASARCSLALDGSWLALSNAPCLRPAAARSLPPRKSTARFWRL